MVVVVEGCVWLPGPHGLQLDTAVVDDPVVVDVTEDRAVNSWKSKG